MRKEMRMRRILACVLVAVLLMPVFAHAETVTSAPLTKASSARNGMVRVYLSSLGTRTSLTLNVDGSYTADGAQNVTLSRGDRVSVAFDSESGQIAVTVDGKRYEMGREVSFRRHATDGSNGLRIVEAKKPANLYPGDLHLVAQAVSGGYKLYPIVHVYMEYYLNGVLPYEMGNGAGLEALKAQAVAARTYTLGRMDQRSGMIYDVVDTTNDQVYYGNSDATANCTAAVNATKGIVVMNGSALTSTYYTASNGGQTEAAENVWGSAVSYLTNRDDPFDKMNTASSVKRTTVYRDNLSSAQHSGLKALLQTKAEAALTAQGISAAGATILTINAITPHTPKYAAPSRVYGKLDFAVTVSTRSGDRALTLTCDIFSELESMLGMSLNTMKNELWTVETSGSDFVLCARRYGHGVGMSQRGAMQMAAMGYTYDQILGFYYPGCKRVQYTFTHTILGPVADGPANVIVTTEQPAEITGGACMATVTLPTAGEQLAIRAQASTQGAVLTGVMNGGVLTVLRTEGAWTLVQLGEIVGYVPTSAITVSGDAPETSDALPTTVTQWATVECSGTLNLREGPSYNSSVRYSLPAGAVLCVFGVSGDWAHVQYGALTGYAAVDFLRMTSTYPQPVAATVSAAAYVTVPGGSGTVRLRASASTSGKILAELPHGTEVTVRSSDGSWCAVSWNGLNGYMMESFLTRKAEEQPPASTEAPGEDAYDHAGPEEEPAAEAPTDAPPKEDTPAETVSPVAAVEAIVHTPEMSIPLHASPSDTSEVLTQLPRLTSVLVTERAEPWSTVRYGSLVGYAATKSLKFLEDDDEMDGLGYAVIWTESGALNLRSQPQAGSAVLMTIPKGTRVMVLDGEGAWTRIRCGDRVGYVMNIYLAAEDEVDLSQEDTEEDVLFYATVMTEKGPLNLRSQPKSGARVVTTIPRGTDIPILSVEDGWCETRYQGKTGYVMQEYLASDVFSDGGEGSAVPVFNGSHIESADKAPAQEKPVETAQPQATSTPETVPEQAESEKHELGEDVPEDEQSKAQEADEAPGGQPSDETADEMHDHGGAAPTEKPAPKPVYDPTLTSDGNEMVGIVNVESGTLNLRAWCATDAPILKKLENETVVAVLAIGSDWTKIITSEGTEGYCVTKYLILKPSF